MNFLDQPEVAPLAHACINLLVSGARFTYLDFPPELGMTEEIFIAIMDEIATQLETGHQSLIH